MEAKQTSDVRAVALGKRPEEIHVLLVDDEKMSRVVVGNLLRKCKYQVTVATSGLEALDILRKHEKGTFHLILTDVMMPDVDGIELLQHVRSDEALNSMPVVMMSANEHTETVFECIRRGAEDYLLKPVTKKEVQYICQHVWRRQKQGPHSVPLVSSEEEGEPLLTVKMPSEQLFNVVPSKGERQGRRMGRSVHLGNESAPIPPVAAAARDAAAELLANRVRSGSDASCSGRQAAAANGNHSGQRHAGPTGAVASDAHFPLSLYFAQRKTVVNSTTSFRIFCAAVALLQDEHSRGKVVRVRPSRLSLTANGTLNVCSSSRRQAEVEDRLYESPEELLNQRLEAASDVYSLGVLFFELFYPVMSASERLHTLSGLRHRILPMSLLQGRPQEAAFVISLLHPDPSARPTAAQLMRHECLSALQCSICRDPDHHSNHNSVDVRVLLDFLRLMHSNKEAEASHIKSHLDIIDKDILQVSQRLRELLANDGKRWSGEEASSDSGGNAMLGSIRGKRDRDASSMGENKTLNGTSYCRTSFDFPQAKGLDGEDRAKWSRIWQDFPVLESVYLQRRESAQVLERLGPGSPPRGECIEGDGGLADFSKDLSLLAKQSKLVVKAEMKYGDLMGEGDMVCSAAFDRDDEFFATAGVSKRIKVFELASVMDEDSMLHYPVLEIGINSKISSLCWNSYIKTCLLAADYEGTIQLWDVSANAVTSQYEEHSKRVWSIDFSKTDPTRFVSGGDDGAVKLWSMRDSAAAATIDSKANVCSVQLSPENSHLLAFGSANYRVYLYDLRKMSKPLAAIGGHQKAVSYVRFLGGDRLVSASTDNTLKLWDVNAASSGSDSQALMTYCGHTNERNFVGLSVNSKGYIACGSESNEVYTYYHRLPLPLTSHSFTRENPRMDADLEGRQFVSTVCWAHKGSNLLSANSAGVIKVLGLAH